MKSSAEPRSAPGQAEHTRMMNSPVASTSRQPQAPVVLAMALCGICQVYVFVAWLEEVMTDLWTRRQLGVLLQGRAAVSDKEGTSGPMCWIWLTSGESSQSDLMDEATVKRSTLTT